MHEGHRSRMIEKLNINAEMLSDHELLEILLYYALPRVNTNPIAHRLIETFGSVDRVLAASPEELAAVEGMGKNAASYLACLNAFYTRLQNKTKKSDVLPKRFGDGFPDYLRRRFAGRTTEELVAFFLDKNDKIVFVKSFESDRVESVSVSPTEITKILASGKYYAVVFAHNHVGDDARPSPIDDDFTKQCELLFSLNNVRLIDHFIVSEDEVYSYYGSGKMQRISEKFHVKKVVSEVKE